MTRAQEAAQLHIFALTGVLPEGARVQGDAVYIDSSELLEPDTAAAHLADLSKPLKTQANLRDGRLWIQTTPLDEGWRRVHDFTLKAKARDARSDGKVLFHSRGLSRIVDVAVYNQWIADYVHPAHASLSGGSQPSPEQSAQGIVEVWHIGRPTPVPEAYALQDDAGVLCDRCKSAMAATALRQQTEYGDAQFVCTLCFEAVRGLSLIHELNRAGAVPPIPEPESDEALRRFFTQFLQSMGQGPESGSA
jgi:hypothetical protein